MQSDQVSSPRNWYIWVADRNPGESPWADDEDAERWLESVGVDGGGVVEIEPGWCFWLQLSLPDVIALRDASYMDGVARPVTGFHIYQFGEGLNDDALEMSTSPLADRCRSVHDLSYATTTVWSFAWLTEDEARHVADTLDADPRLSTPIVSSNAHLNMLCGDLPTARGIVQALDVYDDEGEMVSLRESLRAWVKWMDAKAPKYRYEAVIGVPYSPKPQAAEDASWKRVQAIESFLFSTDRPASIAVINEGWVVVAEFLWLLGSDDVEQLRAYATSLPGRAGVETGSRVAVYETVWGEP